MRETGVQVVTKRFAFSKTRRKPVTFTGFLHGDDSDEENFYEVVEIGSLKKAMWYQVQFENCADYELFGVQLTQKRSSSGFRSSSLQLVREPKERELARMEDDLLSTV